MLSFNGAPLKDFRFPDNTFRMTGEDCDLLHQVATNYTASPDETYRQHVAAFEGEGLVNVVWKYERPEELFQLQCMVAHLRDKMNVKNIYLFMPYVPNARMDRTKDPMSEVNVLKYFCRAINDMNFNAVTVCDAHSDATINQLDRVIQFSMKEFVAGVADGTYDGLKYDYLFFPDDGAAKRYAPIYNFRPYLVGKKDRNWGTGAINSLLLENPMNIDPATLGDKRVLIVDDICSRGGTFVHASVELAKFGFKHIGLCVTHLENTVFIGKLLKSDSLVEMIYTTDSLQHAAHDKICTVHIDEY